MANFYGRSGIEFSNTLMENLQEFERTVRPAALVAVAAGAEIIKQHAYKNANVSPGVMGHGVGGTHMRDQIQVVTTERPTSVIAKAIIDLNVIPYAPHQEFGPHGNRFMTRAVDESRQEVHETVRTVFTAQIGANGKFKTSVKMRRYA